jgi:hypothetical protein
MNRRIHDYRSASLSLSNIANLLASEEPLSPDVKNAIALELESIQRMISKEMEVFKSSKAES